MFNSISSLIFSVSVLLIIVLVESEIPSYIHVCKRNDPEIEKCIINSVENLRPKLIQGIPELDVPSLDPLRIPEVAISRGGAFRAIGTDIVVTGTGNFEITDLKANVRDLVFNIGIRFPHLNFDAIYDVNVKLLTVPIKGKGPINANATDIDGTAILKGHKVKRDDGKTYVNFDSLELKMKLKNYSVKMDNLFSGDKALGEAVNRVLNDNKKEMMQVMRPQVEATVSKVLLDIANKITMHFEYNELFPEK
uniref:Secreted Juvenile haemolymph binding protein-like protein n=1 Tax=Pristhesancus plagipennis TaxID=1955184 RepID=A0A2K8JM92_PRIPG|nr:secreted Juvenile haemolymph binding protein-like protein [Pristhesancus plagipennis]